MTPQEYHASPAWGSTKLRCWMDCAKSGDWRTFKGRYLAGPFLDEWRRQGWAIPAEHATTVELVDAARFDGSPSTVRGSLVEAFLWSPDDPAEIEWADGGKATAAQVREAKRLATLIATIPESWTEPDDPEEAPERIPGVCNILAMGETVERQASEFAALRGVPCRSRVDLAWDVASGRVLVDFKLWTGWTWDVRHLLGPSGALTQAALYRLISEASRPNAQHHSALLVVDPGNPALGKLPREHWHLFDETEMQVAMAEVNTALDQIAAAMRQEAA